MSLFDIPVAACNHFIRRMDWDLTDITFLPVSRHIAISTSWPARLSCTRLARVSGQWGHLASVMSGQSGFTALLNVTNATADGISTKVA